MQIRISIQMSMLPESVRDAVKVVRGMGCRWLWIDSLCIIKDNLRDWATESVRMGDVYRDALFTTAADVASNVLAGFLQEHGLAEPTATISCIRPSGDSVLLSARSTSRLCKRGSRLLTGITVTRT